LVLGTWYLVLGTWYLVLGTWYLVLGTWYLVLGTWYLVLGRARMGTVRCLFFSGVRGEAGWLCLFHRRPPVHHQPERVERNAQGPLESVSTWARAQACRDVARIDERHRRDAIPCGRRERFAKGNGVPERYQLRPIRRTRKYRYIDVAVT
jgi:hypothetical protein